MENVVYVAAPRDWFDYLATGATLLLSVIAVIIAVSTAKQQNRIALFKERYETYQCIYNFLHAWVASKMFILNDSFLTTEIIAANRGFICFFSRFTSNINPDLIVNDIRNFDKQVAYSHYMNIKLNINRLYKLFRLTSAERDYLKKIEHGYEIISALESLNTQNLSASIEACKQSISTFFEILDKKDNFLEALEKQVDVNRL